MTALLARWTEKLAGGPQTGTSDFPQLQGSWEWVYNNNNTSGTALSLCALGFLSMFIGSYLTGHVGRDADDSDAVHGGMGVGASNAECDRIYNLAMQWTW